MDGARGRTHGRITRDHDSRRDHDGETRILRVITTNAQNRYGFSALSHCRMDGRCAVITRASRLTVSPS